jgi:hypothetical protein
MGEEVPHSTDSSERLSDNPVTIRIALKAAFEKEESSQSIHSSHPMMMLIAVPSVRHESSPFNQ